MSKEMPFIAMGWDEMEKLPYIKKGASIICPSCKKKHVLKCATDKDGLDTGLLFYKCKKKTYIAAIKGKSIMGRNIKK